MFSHDFREVALIRKTKPEWQAGLLNGIGGKIEPGEGPLVAMVREFREETGCETGAKSETRWSHFVTMGDGSWSVDFYATTGDLWALMSQEEEKIEIVKVDDVWPKREEMIENLPWLIALAIDHLVDGRPNFANVDYS